MPNQSPQTSSRQNQARQGQGQGRQGGGNTMSSGGNTMSSGGGRASAMNTRSGGDVAGSSKPAADPVYGLVSVLYHALQGAETYEQYAADARRDSDEELEQFFMTCRGEEHSRAQQAKLLLAERLEDEVEDEEEAAGSSDEDDDEDEDEDEDE